MIPMGPHIACGTTPSRGQTRAHSISRAPHIVLRTCFVLFKRGQREVGGGCGKTSAPLCGLAGLARASAAPICYLSRACWNKPACHRLPVGALRRRRRRVRSARARNTCTWKMKTIQCIAPLSRCESSARSVIIDHDDPEGYSARAAALAAAHFGQDGPRRQACDCGREFSICIGRGMVCYSIAVTSCVSVLQLSTSAPPFFFSSPTA